MDDDVWTARADETRRQKADRAKQLWGYEDVVAAIEALLFRHDPIGVNFESNSDEYRPEAETITSRLADVADDDATVRVVHEEFVRWFDPTTAGEETKYRAIGAEIWNVWSQRQHVTDHGSPSAPADDKGVRPQIVEGEAFGVPVPGQWPGVQTHPRESDTDRTRPRAEPRLRGWRRRRRKTEPGSQDGPPKS